MVIHKIKTTLALHKPAYIRICILELNKVLMYEFCYDYVKKKKYGNKSGLLFTDTDSLICEIATKMFMTMLVRIKKCLTLLIILLCQNIMLIQKH